jgi:Beta-ketoacyl synthase, N-terminal domain
MFLLHTLTLGSNARDSGLFFQLRHVFYTQADHNGCFDTMRHGEFTSLTTERKGLLCTDLKTPLQPRIEPDDIAVVGMACRVAGGNDTPEKLWESLLKKQVASSEIPAMRWEPYYRRDSRNPKVSDLLLLSSRTSSSKV